MNAISLALLDLLDLNTFDEGLEPGAELAGGGIDVFLFNGADGDAEVALHDHRVDDSLIAPVLTELVGCDDQTVSIILLDQLALRKR